VAERALDNIDLEQAIGFTNDDERVEVTTSSVRLRKRVLAANQRPRR
jgi:GTP-binding protein